MFCIKSPYLPSSSTDKCQVCLVLKTVFFLFGYSYQLAINLETASLALIILDFEGVDTGNFFLKKNVSLYFYPCCKQPQGITFSWTLSPRWPFIAQQRFLLLVSNDFGGQFLFIFFPVLSIESAVA
jgi:hypothetical protein